MTIEGKVHLKINSKKEVILKIPSWSKPVILINHTSIIINKNYINIGKGKFDVDIDFNLEIKQINIEDKIAFTYGPIVLGLDEKGNPNINLEEIKASLIGDFQLIDNSDAQMIAFKAKYKGTILVFKDYASCGKYLDLDKCYMTAFINGGTK